MTIFYRRTRGEMPAYAEEIEAALRGRHQDRELVAPGRASSPRTAG